MKNKLVLYTVLVALALSTFGTWFYASTETSGTICIRSDGSVDPATAPIQRDGNFYTLTGDIQDSIVIERDDIVMDGAGYKVQGARTGKGLDLSWRNNVTVRNTYIASFEYGIDLSDSSNNTVIANALSDNVNVGMDLYNSTGNILARNTLSGRSTVAIDLSLSANCTVNGNLVFDATNGIWGVGYHNTVSRNHVTGVQGGCAIYSGGDRNTVSRNVLTKNGDGIWVSGVDNTIVGNMLVNSGSIFLESCHNSTVRSNTVMHSEMYGISMRDSHGNTICYNNFVGNAQQVDGDTLADNVYDDRMSFNCPVCNDKRSKGNYWSDYTGMDNGASTQAHNCISDGIGDTATPHLGLDKYPLVCPWVPIEGDINLDGIVNIIDIAIAAKDFRRTEP